MGISSAMGPSALIPSGFGFRNLIINGDFRVAQRDTSFTSTGSANNDDTYNLDRWTILSDGNDAVDITQTTDVPTGGLNSIGLDVETANKKFGIIQFVENRNIGGIQNKNVWLSFKARTTGSSISNVKAVVLSWTGTADTVTSDVVSAWGADGVTPTWATSWTAENTPTNLGVTNTWGEYRVNALMDTSAIKNVAVFIWCDDTSTTVGDFLYITDVQLEINESPTPFERRPFGIELQLCQRYYEKSYDYATAVGTLTVTGSVSTIYSATYTAAIGFRFQVRKRGTPTVTGYPTTSGTNNGSGYWTSAGDATNRVVTFGSIGESGVRFVQLTSSTTNAVYEGHYVAQLEL
jgi:hypothetical protein